ncbi:MAG: IS66 family transposase [Rhodopila sp.]
MDGTDSLPNDLAECQRLLLAAFRQATQLERRVLASEQQVAELNRVLGETATSYQELQQEHSATLDELAWYKRWAYGRRRERFHEDQEQGHLFELNPDSPAPTDFPEPMALDDAVDVCGHRRHRKKREIDWDKLPQIRHEHDLPEEEKTCSCCGRRMDRIGEDVTRELELQPAKLEAHIHVRPKYACRCCKKGVCAAPLPQRPIPGGIAGPGLVSEVLVSKYGDHLPLYRLEDIVARAGVYIARSTLCDWVKYAAELFQPLYELQCQRVLQSTVMWTDDTPITVLGGPQGSFQGRFWTYIGHEQPYSVYDFTTSRSRDGPASFLQGFAGYLHADAFAGYDAIFLGSHAAIREVACWAHARRKFFDAVKSHPRESHQVLEWIRQLYDIEDRARPWSPEARRQLRAAESIPVLDKIGVSLTGLARTALPKSSVAKAVNYVRNQWEALRRYTEDGRLTIDNNVSERTLRHQAIGRKNWLFLGSEAAGPRAAVLCTILAGAKRHRIEPWSYVRDLLLRLHADDQRLDELLPDRWAAAHPEAVLTHRLDESRAKATRTRARRAHRRAHSK